MNIQKVIATAIEQDSRNKFQKYDGNLDRIPDEFKPFYRDYNPVDVEIASTLGDVRFYPYEELVALQTEYAYINARFVFATINGDPVFFHDGKMYTCPHGVKASQWEAIDLDNMI